MTEREQLFEKRFLGTLTPAEAEELKRLLREDDGARRDFVRFTQERGILVQLAQRAAETAVPRRRPRRFARPGGSPLGWIAAAAALLVAVVAGLSAGKPSTPPAPLGRAPRPSPPKEDVDAERLAQEEMARADAETRAARTRLEAVERERRQEETRRAQEELAALEVRRRAAERELERIREERRRAEEERAAKAVEPPAPPPVTIASVATLENVRGDVILTAGERRSPAADGKALLSGEGLAALEASASVTLAFPDGTRIELGGDTVVQEVVERTSRDVGKSLFVARGVVTARVEKQPTGAALSIRTPQGEARVLGTTLKVAVDATATRLEVREGKARLLRTADAKSVDVEAGHYALTTDLAARPILPPRIDQTFDQMPAWAGQWDAVWGSPSAWALGASPWGRALVASRAGQGSSVKTLVFDVPPNREIEVSVWMKAPRAAGSWFAETAVQPGLHTAESFDLNPKDWTLVHKFDGNGNGNQWTRYAAKLNTGAFTQLTVGFKHGAAPASAPAVAWDTLRISW